MKVGACCHSMDSRKVSSWNVTSHGSWVNWVDLGKLSQVEERSWTNVFCICWRVCSCRNVKEGLQSENCYRCLRSEWERKALHLNVAKGKQAKTLILFICSSISIPLLLSWRWRDRRRVWCSLGHLLQQARHWCLGAKERYVRRVQSCRSVQSEGMPSSLLWYFLLLWQVFIEAEEKANWYSCIVREYDVRCALLAYDLLPLCNW